MNMRKLNTFASGVSSGIGQGSQIANRKRLVDMDEEKLGLLKNADKRAGDEAAEMSQWMRGWRDRYQMRGAPGEGEAPAPATPVAPSITQQPAPMPMPFAGTAPNPAAQPSPFAAQGPAQATQLLQQAQTPDRRRLPFMGY